MTIEKSATSFWCVLLWQETHSRPATQLNFPCSSFWNKQPLHMYILIFSNCNNLVTEWKASWRDCLTTSFRWKNVWRSTPHKIEFVYHHTGSILFANAKWLPRRWSLALLQAADYFHSYQTDLLIFYLFRRKKKLDCRTDRDSEFVCD